MALLLSTDIYQNRNLQCVYPSVYSGVCGKHFQSVAQTISHFHNEHRYSMLSLDTFFEKYVKILDWNINKDLNNIIQDIDNINIPNSNNRDELPSLSTSPISSPSSPSSPVSPISPISSPSQSPSSPKLQSPSPKKVKHKLQEIAKHNAITTSSSIVKSQQQQSQQTEPQQEPQSQQSQQSQQQEILNRLTAIEKILKKSQVKLCVVCWERERNHALIPCGHYMLCGDCAFNVLSGKAVCPYCDKRIVDLQHIWDVGKDKDESE
jgi:hypothetical protein